ncbi:ricin-type beta-trefoil lectin domain protein [Micromonospora sp. 067-2]|uniref:ricin-type beta-trefoil lectin domain protein n=1 Tax=Micromonospora sp. 067-2 TaxID=2789270 RepID=UPI00397B1974
MIRGLRGRWCALLVGVLVAAGLVVPAGQPTAWAAAATSITVDGTKGGRVWDGIGAVSGGGGNSRLLIDYPPTQRAQILDYLFKPNYGASLEMLKIEVGGDTNSTDGAEPSHQHVRGQINCNVGYEFWLAKEAKARNPTIKLLGLAWGAPGWVGNGSFWTQDMVDYYLSWLDCAKNTHGLTIDYLGGWNEKGDNRAWFLNLDAALRTRYPNTRIVADDTNIDFADTLASDPTYRAAVDVIGTHYPCGWLKESLECPSNANAINSGKPIWASEGGSQDMTTGNGALVRQLNRGYLDGRYTGFIHWPRVAGLYPHLPFSNVGYVLANQPWSGSYTVGKVTWVTAHYTQFTDPGWTVIEPASGYLGGSRTNGSYLTLKAPGGGDYTSVIETSTATEAQTVNVAVTGGLSTGPVRVWATNLATGAATSQILARQADVTPSGGRYSLTLQPNHVYTVTTTSGQTKGSAGTPPAGRALPLPYSDDFESYPVNAMARYLSDMQGSFEVRNCAGGRSGRCVQQVAPSQPIIWQGQSDTFTLLGDTSWRDYTVKVDTLMQQAGTTTLLGRVNTQGRPAGNQRHYQLKISNTGAWSLGSNVVKSGCAVRATDCFGVLTTLASGTTTALGTNSWHTLSMTFNGSSISAAVDGRTLTTVTNSTHAAGVVGFGVGGYQTNMWDNLSITPAGTQNPGTGGPLTNGVAGMCAASSGGGSANDTPVVIAHCDSGAAQRFTYESESIRFGGKCLDVNARGTANGSTVLLWDCTGATNQRWTVGANSSLVNPVSGRCLDNPASSTVDGTQLVIWDCNTRANQRWTLP